MSMKQSINTAGKKSLGKEFYIVGIGASAGGLDAIEQFFSKVPADSGMAYIVVQHLSSKYKSFMPELLAKKTKMKILRIKEGMQIQPDTIYLNPPDSYTSIEDGTFKVSGYEKDKQLHFPIDAFLISLAASKKDKAVSIIFSGKGNDGTAGVKAIKDNGGTVIVQDGQSAKFNDMPESAILSGYADYIEAPSNMPSILSSFNESVLPRYSQETLEEIFGLIKKKTGLDFACYKKNSIIRRIERRILQLESKHQSVEQYLDYLQANSGEVEHLQKDLLIGVTHFFRDEEAFKIIEDVIVPEAVHRKAAAKEELRIWIAGCSTGQEAYSYAILFDRYVQRMGLDLNIRVFATDINKDAIEFARRGIYPGHQTEGIPKELLKNYFVKKGDSWEIIKRIRSHVVFAPHNLIKDSPFVNMDLISCRNVMIYFQPDLQRKLLSLFNFALTEKGTLVLGHSETTGKMSHFFRPVNSKWNIYKNAISENWVVQSEGRVSKMPVSADQAENRSIAADSLSARRRAAIHQTLMDNYVLPCIVLNEVNEVIFTSRRANKYLNFLNESASKSIYKMVPVHLSVMIWTALKKLDGERSEVRYKNVHFDVDGENRYFDLIVKKFAANESLVIILFDEDQNTKEKKTMPLYFDPHSTVAERIADLEQELYYTQQTLQTTIEELETSNEELQSANEELIAANEEMQSANEEMHSINEELVNVNNEYEQKIKEVTALADDMDNLLISTNIAAVFLDAELNIRLFTPEAKKVINVIDMDVGRPFFHISHNFEQASLVEDAERVVKSFSKIEKELMSKDHKWYLMQAFPYRTSENVMDGVVFTFNDITEIKRFNQKLKLTSNALDQSPSRILIIDKSGNIEYHNREFAEHEGKPDSFVGRNIKDLYRDQMDTADFEEIENAIIAKEVWKGSMSYPLDGGIARWENVCFLPIEDQSGDVSSYLGIIEDITVHKASEAMLQKSEMLSAVGQLAAGIVHEIRNPLTSLKGFLQLMMQTGSYNKEYTEVMMSEFGRLEAIIDEFLVLAKPKAAVYDLVNVSKVIQDVCVLLDTQAIMQNISITAVHQDALPKIRGNEKELKQVFINMVKNAIEAMENGGTILIETGMEGKNLLVKISDQGKGIPEKQLNKMGEPFYTTKEKGTGLGVMVSFRIIENHKGTLNYASIEGKGTTAEIRIPCIQ